MSLKAASLLLLVFCFLLLLPSGTDKGEHMAFSDIIMKLAEASDALSPAEKQELHLQAKSLENTNSMLQHMIQPGSNVITVDGLVANRATINVAEIMDAKAGNGDVSIDGQGMWIKNQQAAFGFEDTNNERFNIYLSSSGTNALQLNNKIPGAAIMLRTELTSGPADIRIDEDDAMADRIMLRVEPLDGGNGGRFNVADKFEFRAESFAGNGETFMRVMQATNTPALPGQNDAFHLYLRNNKLILQYNDAGTIRYKYLDLTGTGVTWVHTTTAP